MEIEQPLINRRVQSAIHRGQEVALQVACSSQVELAKKGYDEIEREKGSKALAYSLGVGWFQARQHSFSNIEQAIRSCFPRLTIDAELLQIFHTAIQHGAEEQRAFDALFNSPYPLSEQERKEKLQRWTALTEKRMIYMEQLVMPQQQPMETTISAHCKEGKNYQRLNGLIPSDHLRTCSICSA